LVKLAAAFVAALLLAPAAHAASYGPALDVPRDQLAGALRCPVGKTAHRDKPIVLLVHGTGTTGEDSWPDGLGIVLRNTGFAWCMVTIPGRELGDIQTSAEYVVHAVRDLAKKHRGKVDLIGHSQGADEIRWTVRWWPGARKQVEDLVTIEGANQGVNAASGLCAIGDCTPAVWQFRPGSNFLAALNKVPTPAGPSYTAIGSMTDELLQPALPFETSTYRIPGGGATNVLVQDLCPGRPVVHVQAIYDAAELAIVMDALQHAGAAKLARVDKGVCSKVFAPGIDPVTAIGDIAGLYATAAGPIIFPSAATTSREPALRPYATGR
jgi:triacylglycerol esterase/lipase EstA (alpha/beta hydrolase family)